MLKGKDSGELPILFRDSLKDNYDDYHTPNDFIEIFIDGITAAEAQGEATITLSPKDTLYLFEL